jgi:PAS domain S-box-containing protein
MFWRAVALSCLAVLSRTARADTARASDDVPRGHSRFHVFGAAEGLRNLVIVGIAQDDDGFLWVGTNDGVYRLHGERFSRVSVEPIASSINALSAAPDGRICAGGNHGLACWDGKRFSQTNTHGLPAGRINTMVSFAGKLWVGTDRAGLYVQQASGGFAPAPGWGGSRARTIFALWSDARGLVVGDGATVQLSSGDGVWRGIGNVGLGGERVAGVLRDRNGTLWIRTPTGIWKLPANAEKASDLSAGLPPGTDAITQPTAMAIGPRGNVLIATDVGIAERDNDRWRVMSLAPSLGAPEQSTRALFVDREATVWVGATGVFQLRGRGVIEHHDATTGLPGDIVWSYQRDRHGTLWIGTNRCLARAIAGRWECLPGTEGRVVLGMVFPPQGGVFVGGSPSDLLYIDAGGHPISLGSFDRAPDSIIEALALGPEGDLWIGTRAGLYRLAGAIPGPLERVVIPGVRLNLDFASFAVAGGRLWAPTSDGLAVRDHGTWQVLDTTAGFRDTAMRYVAAGADGRLCAAYLEPIGLSCFRYANRTVSELEHIGTAQGLSTGMVYFLGEDHQHRLWIGTGDGVDVMTSHGVDHFDDRDGLTSNDSAANAFMADSDGSLWLGASGGGTHVFAQDYEGPAPPPRTAFLNGRLGDLAIEDAHGVLEAPHDHNTLALEFGSSSRLDEARVRYEVRLVPMETGWTATHQREARYPGLPPGVYRFEVRACIGAGTWGPVASLGFTVLPAWWQTRWFLALAGLSGLAGISAGCWWWLQRRTRQLHARSEESFRAVIDLMPDLISVYRDRKLSYLNLANRRFLGLDGPAPWDGLELIERVHPDDRALVSELFLRVRTVDPQPAAEVIEIRIRAADGSWRVCEVSGIRVDVAGVVTVVGSGRDVTERKRLRAKLLVSDRMASLGTLAAGIAHEINNPLACVTGNLEIVAETLQAAVGASGAIDGSAQVEATAAICDARDGAERVRKIVQGLRVFSRSDDERRVPLALSSVLEAAIRMTGNELRHRAQLVRELRPVPMVVADDGRLTQVFINLLVNAAQAIAEGHSDRNRVIVRTRTDDQGRAVIEVEDTGKGIGPEVLARVFDPFFTTKDVGVGTGLGLSICHGIISGIGGQISIESRTNLEHPAGTMAGTGTIVRVVLPPARLGLVEPPPAPREPSAAAPALRRHRVLLVDDEPLVAHTMERLLRRDYDTTVVDCGRDALEHITRGQWFDAIVSDVMMPNMTGIELLEELERLAPDQAQRMIFLSGGAFTAQTRERLDEIQVTQLEKPVTAKQLRASVLQVVHATSKASAPEANRGFDRDA